MPSYFRSVQGGHPNEFERAINRRIGTRSRSLKAAVAAVNQFVRAPSENQIRQVIRAIEHWRTSDPGEWRRRFQRTWPTFSTEMREAAGRYNEVLKCLAESIDVTPTTPAEALAWVKQVDTPGPNGLQQFSTFACLDATTFRHCIRPAAKNPVLQREAAWKAGNYRAYGNSSGMAMIPSLHWNAAKLRNAYNRISGEGGRGAVCTTFGLMAAHILTNGRVGGPRVELVAYPNGRRSHIYVLVGRQGLLTNQGRLPNDWDAVVVDAWAASLGHDCIYANKASYRFQAMSNNLELKMLRPQS